MKQGILFDLDGTLWDSAQAVVDSWNCLLYTSYHGVRDDRIQCSFKYRRRFRYYLSGSFSWNADHGSDCVCTGVFCSRKARKNACIYSNETGWQTTVYHLCHFYLYLLHYVSGYEPVSYTHLLRQSVQFLSVLSSWSSRSYLSQSRYRSSSL